MKKNVYIVIVIAYKSKHQNDSELFFQIFLSQENTTGSKELAPNWGLSLVARFELILKKRGGGPQFLHIFSNCTT